MKVQKQSKKIKQQIFIRTATDNVNNILNLLLKILC